MSLMVNFIVGAPARNALRSDVDGLGIEQMSLLALTLYFLSGHWESSSSLGFSIQRKSLRFPGARQARLQRCSNCGQAVGVLAHSFRFTSVGALGIEPSLHEPESCVLPVYDAPFLSSL